jgi:tetratricopeptide (TPR) repeat protein
MVFFILLPLSCAAPKKMGKKVPAKGGSATKSEVSILEERFARLVKDTESILLQGQKKPDPGRFKEFYETPLEKVAMLYQAKAYLKAGDLENSLKTYEDLEKKHPGFQEATSGMSDVLLELASRSILTRDTDSARKYLGLARQREADMDTYLYNSALVRLLEGKKEEGINLLEKTTPPFKKTALYGLLESQLKGQKFVYYLEGKRLPLEIKSAILNYTAMMAFESGDVEKAEELLALAVEEKLAVSETYTLLGNALFEKGRFIDASKQYKKGIEANPQAPENYLNLGIVSEIYLQDFSLARSSYSSYLNLGGEKSDIVNKWLTNLDLMEKTR